MESKTLGFLLRMRFRAVFHIMTFFILKCAEHSTYIGACVNVCMIFICSAALIAPVQRVWQKRDLLNLKSGKLIRCTSLALAKHNRQPVVNFSRLWFIWNHKNKRLLFDVQAAKGKKRPNRTVWLCNGERNGVAGTNGKRENMEREKHTHRITKRLWRGILKMNRWNPMLNKTICGYEINL